MKLVKTKTRITRYQYNSYCVDIVENSIENTYEAWLQHKDYGISELMFGCATDDEDDFLNIVEANLPGYISLYQERYEDG